MKDCISDSLSKNDAHKEQSIAIETTNSATEKGTEKENSQTEECDIIDNCVPEESEISTKVDTKDTIGKQNTKVETEDTIGEENTETTRESIRNESETEHENGRENTVTIVEEKSETVEGITINENNDAGSIEVEEVAVTCDNSLPENIPQESETNTEKDDNKHIQLREAAVEQGQSEARKEPESEHGKEVAVEETEVAEPQPRKKSKTENSCKEESIAQCIDTAASETPVKVSNNEIEAITTDATCETSSEEGIPQHKDNTCAETSIESSLKPYCVITEDISIEADKDTSGKIETPKLADSACVTVPIASESEAKNTQSEDKFAVDSSTKEHPVLEDISEPKPKVGTLFEDISDPDPKVGTIYEDISDPIQEVNLVRKDTCTDVKLITAETKTAEDISISEPSRANSRISCSGFSKDYKPLQEEEGAMVGDATVNGKMTIEEDNSTTGEIPAKVSLYLACS